ncbi:MAG: FecCD family ABC transporter permease [Fusobacteriaceae bacterium]
MKKFKIYTVTGILFLILTNTYLLTKGYFSIDIKDIILNLTVENAEIHKKISVIKYVRVPRTLVAIFTGALLSGSGVIFQSILHNPLADSYILGIASGASFGASLGIFLGISFLGQFSIPAMAFLGAMISLYWVISISSRNKTLNSNSLILSGVIVSAFFSAGVSCIQFIKGTGIEEIIFWLMGSFSSKTSADAWILGMVTLITIFVGIFFSKTMNILSLGDRMAKANGINVKKNKLILLIFASFISAVAVSITGIIGFVGLMVPHLVRMLIGSDHRKVFPLAIIYGGIITSLADGIIRVYSPTEIPIGVVTAICGAPFFILIFRKKIIGRG